jgi:hypothetical protein
MFADVIFELVYNLLFKSKTTILSLGGLEISIGKGKNATDDKIKKLEIAKANLLEGLSAIEELQKDAEVSKKHLDKTLKEIDGLKADKNRLTSEVVEIQKLKDSDVLVFRELAGVPTPKQKRTDRWVGFITGIITSIVAAPIIWAIGKYLIPWILNLFCATP